MLKKKPLITNLALHRLQKFDAKRVRLAKIQRSRFLTQLRETTLSDDSQQKAAALVEQLHAAKSAEFLRQYRIVV